VIWTGTDVRRVDIDLGGQLDGTGGDGALDAVTVQGTAGNDFVRVSGSDSDVRIQGPTRRSRSRTRSLPTS
jgi:hypothetical protein